MGAFINLFVSASDVRNTKQGPAIGPVGQSVWCTDKINGGAVKNDDAAARKDAPKGVAH